jgi:hypothetical protein
MTPLTDSGHGRLDDHEERLQAGEAALRENTELTRDMAGTVSEMRDLLELGRNGMKVLNFIGRAAVWAGKVAAACTALAAAWYAFTHGGRPPHP